jgi:catechol 2,3-dioxygenase-like lactoylglutathione lyase family enzyme
MRIDHVIYAVSDLNRAVDRFSQDFGLQAIGGGEHREFGTRNEIVPVGSGQFIELLAVAVAQPRHPVAILLSELIRAGDRPMGLCLRPKNVDDVASRLSIAVTNAERHNPGGELLRWRLAGVEAALGPERLPFFVDWQGAEVSLDRERDQVARAEGISWVEYGGDAARLKAWTGGSDVPLRIVDGEPGPRAIALKRGSDEIVIR